MLLCATLALDLRAALTLLPDVEMRLFWSSATRATRTSVALRPSLGVRRTSTGRKGPDRPNSFPRNQAAKVPKPLATHPSPSSRPVRQEWYNAMMLNNAIMLSKQSYSIKQSYPMSGGRVARALSVTSMVVVRTHDNDSSAHELNEWLSW